MNIKTDLIKKGTMKRGGKLISKVGFFVDHDTGNPNSTASGNVNYFKNAADKDYASAHIFVDDKEAIMCIPCFAKAEKAWHVIYNVTSDNKIYGDDANDIAIGLELCYFPNDKERTLKAYNNYIDVASDLAIYHNVDPMKRSGHFELHPSQKIDPNSALKVIGKTYADMKLDIKNLYNFKNRKVIKVEQVTSEWAKEAQKWVIEQGISDGTRPKDVVTREELWTMLYRVGGK